MATVTASAPGRLDFLGGIADYSGSMVLQTPIQAQTTVTLTALKEEYFQLEASGHEPVRLLRAELLASLSSVPTPQAFRVWLEQRPIAEWARYPLGCWFLFAQAFGWNQPGGLHFAVSSTVPTGMGVSSSAALEVATLRALARLTGAEFNGIQIAEMAQRCENHVVGAPCGIMDQLASAFGQPQALLPILCRPGKIFPTVQLPEDTLVLGWPSGVKHSVGASPYGRARAASFMGKTLLEAASGQPLTYTSEWPIEKQEEARKLLPPSLRGADFLSRHSSHGDALSRIDPDMIYPVQAATLFPIEENHRCASIQTWLQGPPEADLPRHIGACLFASDTAYRAMGLGSPETDLMVNALQDKAEEGIYGARISGGGSGGTVVVYLHRQARIALESIMRQLTPDCAGLIA